MIPLWIFTLSKVFSSCSQFHFAVFHIIIIIIIIILLATSLEWEQFFSDLQGDSDNAQGRMVKILDLVFYSFCPLSKHLGTIPSAPTTVGITVILMFRFF